LDNELFLALFITAVGMTLLFLSLGLFYGLLSLMTRLFQDQPAGSSGFFAKRKLPVEVTTTEPGTPEGPDRLRAAVVAAALARAEAELGSESTAARGEGDAAGLEPSPWWSLHHQRRMDTHAATRRTR
jgi:hypothetical protein